MKIRYRGSMATTKKRAPKRKRPSKLACKRRAKALPKKRSARAGKALGACRRPAKRRSTRNGQRISTDRGRALILSVRQGDVVTYVARNGRVSTGTAWVRSAVPHEGIRWGLAKRVSKRDVRLGLKPRALGRMPVVDSSNIVSVSH